MFWPLWWVLTAAVTVSAARLFSSFPARREQSPESRFRWSPPAAIALLILAVFLGSFIFLILVGEDFAWPDDGQLTNYSLRGISFPPPIWSGRFFPLAIQEFNLIRHLTTSVTGYHLLSIVQILAIAFILLILDDDLSIAGRAVVIVFVLLIPSVLVSYMGLIYPERNLLFLLSCMAISIKKFERTNSAWWAVAAVVSAQFMLYLKEPMFLMLLGFSGARLFLRNRNVTRRWGEENLLDVCLAAISLLFLAFYALMIFPHTRSEYLDGFQVSLGSTIAYYLREEPLAWILLAVVAARMVRVVSGKTAPALLWDGLACGGVVYFLAYLGLRLTHEYYLAPVDFIAAIYLGHLLLSSWGEMRVDVRIAAATLAAIILYLNLSLATFRIFVRKYDIHEKTAIANLILERHQRDPRRVEKLYFPYTGSFQLSEFAAYLRYRGLPVEDETTGLGRGQMEISSPRLTKVGRCLWYKPFLCHPRDETDPGTLIVVLPGDYVPPLERTKSGEPLLSSVPGAAIPALARRLLDRLPFWPVLPAIDSMPTVFVGVSK